MDDREALPEALLRSIEEEEERGEENVGMYQCRPMGKGEGEGDGERKESWEQGEGGPRGKGKPEGEDKVTCGSKGGRCDYKFTGGYRCGNWCSLLILNKELPGWHIGQPCNSLFKINKLHQFPHLYPPVNL
jgi:hypothetical protein